MTSSHRPLCIYGPRATNWEFAYCVGILREIKAEVLKLMENEMDEFMMLRTSMITQEHLEKFSAEKQIKAAELVEKGRAVMDYWGEEMRAGRLLVSCPRDCTIFREHFVTVRTSILIRCLLGWKRIVWEECDGSVLKS
jgi:hypothetical protein